MWLVTNRWEQLNILGQEEDENSVQPNILTVWSESWKLFASHFVPGPEGQTVLVWEASSLSLLAPETRHAQFLLQGKCDRPAQSSPSWPKFHSLLLSFHKHWRGEGGLFDKNDIMALKGGDSPMLHGMFWMSVHEWLKPHIWIHVVVVNTATTTEKHTECHAATHCCSSVPGCKLAHKTQLDLLSIPHPHDGFVCHSLEGHLCCKRPSHVKHGVLLVSSSHMSRVASFWGLCFKAWLPVQLPCSNQFLLCQNCSHPCLHCHIACQLFLWWSILFLSCFSFSNQIPGIGNVLFSVSAGTHKCCIQKMQWLLVGGAFSVQCSDASFPSYKTGARETNSSGSCPAFRSALPAFRSMLWFLQFRMLSTWWQRRKFDYVHHQLITLLFEWFMHMHIHSCISCWMWCTFLHISSLHFSLSAWTPEECTRAWALSTDGHLLVAVWWHIPTVSSASVTPTGQVILPSH